MPNFRYCLGSFSTPAARGGFGPSTMVGSSQQGGPGNYNPPIEKTPAPRHGTPGKVLLA